MGDVRGRHARAGDFLDTSTMPITAEAYVPRHGSIKQGIGEYAVFDNFAAMDTLDAVQNPKTDRIREELKRCIIGQDAAIDALIEAYDRVPARSAYDQRPVATLAFLGPTGVGKSETAKVLAEFLTEGEANSLIKIDCSNFSHGHEVAALAGPPPGYVGYGQKPILSADKVLDAKVILFDEIEKGAPELFRLMLQIMGDGQLRLNDGSVANFCNTVIIMTSNLGAKEMSTQLNGANLGFGIPSRRKDKASLEKVATKSFEEYFAPEFMNRINKMVVFHPLEKDAIIQVLDTKMAIANREYESAYGARVILSEGAKGYLADRAMQRPDLGARPLVRALEEDIQTPFGRYYSGGHIPEGTLVAVIHRDELPPGHIDDDRTLIFLQSYDPTIKKWMPPVVSEELIQIESKKNIQSNNDDDSSTA